MINFITDFENLSDKNLYQYCKTIGFNARKWHRRFIATIPEVAKRRLYKKYGYCSIHEFTAKLAGVSQNNTDEVLRVSEKFSEMPKMKALIGEIGLSKLKIVACISTKDTDDFWAEKVRNMTKSSLELYVREMKTKDSQGRIVAKFPGELVDKNLKIPQQQEQIDMFGSEKTMSQNFNGARLESIQNHDKKTFTIRIDEETEFELRKFKQLLEKERKEPIDWNSALKEMVKRVTSEQIVGPNKLNKSAKPSYPRTKPEKPINKYKNELEQQSQPTAVSRYIPAKIKHELDQKHQGHCAYRGCNKPAEQIHHNNRFAITKSHEDLIPLCKIHHDFLHQSCRTSLCMEIFQGLRDHKHAYWLPLLFQ